MRNKSTADKASLSDPSKLRAEFWALPNDALVDRETLAAVRYVQVQTLELEAIKGGGPPYLKIGRRALYRKGDYLAWVESRGQVVDSTSQLKRKNTDTSGLIEKVAA